MHNTIKCGNCGDIKWQGDGCGEQWGWWITEKCPLHDQRASDAAKRGEESK